MRRRKSREIALQILFALENQTEESAPPSQLQVDTAIQAYLKNFAAKNQEEITDVDYLTRLLRGICLNVEKIDEELEKFSDHWKLYRMTRIDRNVLRIGAQELKFPDVPPRVVIDECVELAKKFGNDDSSAFVNGILDKIRMNSDRSNE